MRIYTEVNFQWDDKQNQLVETSSKSFDYSGPMALCADWEEQSARWYDDAGRIYKTKWKYQAGLVRDQRIFVSNDGGATWEKSGTTQHKNRKKSEARDLFKTHVANRSTASGKAHTSRETWKSWWMRDVFDGNEPPEGGADTDLNQKYLDSKYNPDSDPNNEYVYFEGGKDSETAEYWEHSLTTKEWDDLSAEEQGMYVYDRDENRFFKIAATHWTDEQYDIEEAKVIKTAEEGLDAYIREWEKITGEKTDEFQRELLEETLTMEQAEGWIEWEKEELTREGGTLDIIKDTWETTVQQAKDTYTTAYNRIMGDLEYDAEGNITGGGEYHKELAEIQADFERDKTRAEEQYNIDYNKLMGEGDELGFYETERRRIEEEYTTAEERFMGVGATIEDPDNAGVFYTPAEALAKEIITEDEYLEMAGEYALSAEELADIREEGLEGTVTTREEELGALREKYTGTATTKGLMRDAEAKIGAAGFAATGVGRTAREVLAEEIGEEARDVELGFEEERTDIKESYKTEKGALEVKRTTSLEDWLDTKTKDLADLKTMKDDAVAEYEKTRDDDIEDYEAERIAAVEKVETGYGYTLDDAETAETTAISTAGTLRDVQAGQALDPWETRTMELNDLMERFGIGVGLDPFADIAAKAESALSGLQADIRRHVSDVQKSGYTMEMEGVQEWDPFTGKYMAAGKTMGLGPGTVDPGFVEGLFDPTITGELEGKFKDKSFHYDPEFVMPWEEEGYKAPWEE